MGEILEVRSGVWCRQRWCRAGEAEEHHDQDGCSCHPQAGPEPAESAHVGPAEPRTQEPQRELWSLGDEDRPEPLRAVPPSDGAPSRLTILTAKASRLRAFACRACGRNTRRMIEAPEMFFRCEECARADRRPPSRRQA